MKNDIVLCMYLVTIHNEHRKLERLERDCKYDALFEALSNIEMAANMAQEHLNELRFPKKEAA